MAVRADRGGARRLLIDPREPCPTVMACGIGSVNTSQYGVMLMSLEGRGSDKPPYGVPSMKEVAEIRGTNGYKVASTFSGAGGSCLGWEMAGFDVAWANEFVDFAASMYRKNHPETHLDTRDVRQVRAGDVLDALGLEEGELDVFEGSPPCDSFSMAGKRAKGWGKAKAYSGGKHQRTDDLFDEYIRLLRGLRPKVFVAENVAGMVRGVSKGYFKIVLRALRESGYRVSARVLDAQWLGVPQARQRLIFVGVREDLGVEPVHPSPWPYRYSIADACPWIVGGMEKKYGDGFVSVRDIDVNQESSPSITVQGMAGSSVPHVEAHDPPPEMLAREPDGAGGALPPSRQKEDAFNHVHANVEKPSPTVTVASPGNDVSVGVAKRKFYICEAARVCSFPDDFEFQGSFSQRWRVMGMSVPPLMMRAVAETVRDEILGNL